MKRASALCSLAVVATAMWLLVSAEAASATTFCLPAFTAACPNNGTNLLSSSPQSALDTNNSDGQADTLIIDAGTFTEPVTISANGSDPLTIQGAGDDQTVLTTSDTANSTVLNLSGSSRTVTVRDLRVRVPNTMPTNSGTGVQMDGDTLENVDVVSRNVGTTGSDGIYITGGSTLRNVSLSPVNGGALDLAINALTATGTATIEGLTVTGAKTALVNDAPGLLMKVHNAVVQDPIQVAFASNGGPVSVDNALVTSSNAVSPLIADVPPGSPKSSSLTADHVTAVYTGSSGVSALQSDVYSAGTGNADLRVTNSIFRGYTHGWIRTNTGITTATSTLEVDHSNLPLSAGQDSGAGSVTVGAGNITADPLFTSATDFHLLPGSPSIDAGDPAETTASTDLAGAPRPKDGNNDGTKVVDQGVYEVQDTTAPETKIDKGPGPKGKLKKGKATFTFSAGESNATFACKVDKKDFAPCTSPLKLKKLKKGKHTVSIEATDVDGNLDATPATDTFKVKPKKKHHKHNGGGGHGHHHRG